ncbi:MAG: hypothetical protein J7J76_06080 [Candidatus Latescibacteria bacterium]|nr:hypothetical protein [Candidatus Latescibacterota bacterium]
MPRWALGAVYEMMYPDQQYTDVVISIERSLKGSAEDTLTVWHYMGGWRF